MSYLVRAIVVAPNIGTYIYMIGGVNVQVGEVNIEVVCGEPVVVLESLVGEFRFAADILPHGFAAAGHPTDMRTVAGDVADCQISYSRALAGFCAEIHLGKEISDDCCPIRIIAVSVFAYTTMYSINTGKPTFLMIIMF